MPGRNAPIKDPDDLLVRRINAGDAQAFEVLVGRHGQRLYAIAFNMTLRTADAEDLVQETFVAAFEGFGGFRRGATVKTWLTRILFKRIARHFRRQRVRKAEPLNETMPAKGELLTSEKVQMEMDIRRAFGQLEPIFRQVVVLREIEGLSYEEVAQVLHIPRGTVESRLYRARQKLKELLVDYMPESRMPVEQGCE